MRHPCHQLAPALLQRGRLGAALSESRHRFVQLAGEPCELAGAASSAMDLTLCASRFAVIERPLLADPSRQLAEARGRLRDPAAEDQRSDHPDGAGAYQYHDERPQVVTRDEHRPGTAGDAGSHSNDRSERSDRHLNSGRAPPQCPKQHDRNRGRAHRTTDGPGEEPDRGADPHSPCCRNDNRDSDPERSDGNRSSRCGLRHGSNLYP